MIRSQPILVGDGTICPHWTAKVSGSRVNCPHRAAVLSECPSRATGCVLLAPSGLLLGQDLPTKCDALSADEDQTRSLHQRTDIRVAPPAKRAVHIVSAPSRAPSRSSHPVEEPSEHVRTPKTEVVGPASADENASTRADSWAHCAACSRGIPPRAEVRLSCPGMVAFVASVMAAGVTLRSRGR